MGRAGKLIGGLALLAGVGVVVLLAAGVIGGEKRIAPGSAPEPASLPAPAHTVVARRGTGPLTEEAIGTVGSRTVVEIAAQVTARVLEVARSAGQSVEANAPLVVLDAREFSARLAQAKGAVAAAEAAEKQAEQVKVQGEVRLRQATLENERAQKLLAQKIVSTEQAEAAETAFLQAKADLARAEASILGAAAQRGQAQQVVTEAEVALGHTTIASPIAGVVTERHVEPGDLASPGRPLLIVIDPKALRLEARVRERLISRVKLGQSLEVEVPAANARVPAKAAEIVPSADPLSRTFTVRADFPAVEGVYAGMYGRMRIPVGARERVEVPRDAVERVGQLETVVVRIGERWVRRLVSTGAVDAEGWIEILSGLEGGETVGWTGEKP